MIVLDQHAVSERVRLEESLKVDTWDSYTVDKVVQCSAEDFYGLKNKKVYLNKYGYTWQEMADKKSK